MSVSTLVLTSIFTFAISRRYVRNQKEDEVLPILNAVESLWIDYSMGEIDGNNFERFMMSQSMMSNAQLVLIDHEGNLIYASRGIKDDRNENKIELIDLSTSTIFLEILNSKDVYSKTIEIEGSRFSSVVVGKAIQSNETTIGAVAMIVPVFELDRSAASLIFALILSFISVSVLMIGVLYIFSKRLTRPLISMTQVAKALSEGKFELKAEETDPSEIGMLGQSLNQMSSKLKETLDEVLFERTRLKAMLSSMQEGVLSLDLEGKIILMNPALVKHFAVNTEETLVDLLSKEPFKKALESKEVQHVELRKDDQNFLVSISPLSLEDKGSFGTVVVFIDQSESMRLDKMRRDYVANVSHELRTPLTAIRALVDPLNDQLITDENKKLEYYQYILKEIDRLNRLINDLLELSRLQSRQSAFEYSSFNVEHLLHELKDRFESIAKEKNIELKIRVELEDKVWMSSEDRIDQILSIFIDNALKFSQGGSLSLKSYKKQNRLVLEVCDTGPGISKKDLPYIFDRFYTADLARTQKSFGLGLSIAKEIADALGILIEVDTQEDKGSCFRLLIEEAK